DGIHRRPQRAHRVASGCRPAEPPRVPAAHLPPVDDERRRTAQGADERSLPGDPPHHAARVRGQGRALIMAKKSITWKRVDASTLDLKDWKAVVIGGTGGLGR